MMNLRTAFVLVVATGQVSFADSSWLVCNETNGLEYTGYANEGQTNAVNTVPDFSRAGYKGGGVAIPFIPAAVTVSDGPGDDSVLIQTAIDTVSALPLGTNGFRGAVLLKAGDYTVSNTLNIAASGVVIRGEGSQDAGGTRITCTATNQSNLFEVDNGGDRPREVSGTDEVITDAFVPVGATGFNVADASGFAPGDQIIVQNNMNQKWIDDISNMGQWGWTASGYQLTFRRTIVATNGNRVTLDAPLVQAIETRYGGGQIYKYNYSGEMENIGFEGLRLESTYGSETDEDHGWSAIVIKRLNNGWVRQVTGRCFGFGLVNILSNSRQITVEDCAMLDPKSIITGGRRYSFNIDDSQYILMQRCFTRGGRHDFASGSKTPGPNVFVDCRANETYSDIGPHHRYATGQIYDNILGGSINVQNRTDWGSGHGWAGAQVMFWNCDADSIICDAPTGAMNWCVGSIGTKTEGKVPTEPFGIWDSHNTPVQPRSLFYAQLAERLGANALNNIILPQQKTGDVWTELNSWGGNGLFLDGLVVWADEEAAMDVGQPVGIRGMVRNLQLSENISTGMWSKVSGPGTVAFADRGALETTVQFSEPGSYVLELEASTGPVTWLATDNYDSEPLGSKPENACEVRPTTPATDLSTLVVGGSTNIAGSGNAVRILDDLDGTGNGTRMSYRFADSQSGQYPAVRIDFSFAPYTLVGGSSKYIKVSVGEYDNSMTSSAGRFLDCRLCADGTVDFKSTAGPDSSNNALMASNNTMSIFVNDYDAKTVTYTGPDNGSYVLQTNSAAYWLNGRFIIETLMEDRATADGTVFSSTNNIGRFGFVTYSSDVDLDYVIDDVTVRELGDDARLVETAALKVEVRGETPASLYSSWLGMYPELAACSSPMDDYEPDGMVNLVEYALGGNPVSNDAAAILPTSIVAMDGSSNWLYYVYKRRTDAAARGLVYTVMSGTNLIVGLTNEVPPFSVALATNGFEQATHRISTDAADQALMKLQINLED